MVDRYRLVLLVSADVDSPIETRAAALRPRITAAIRNAVIDELAERGFARLSIAAVIRRG